jgi:PAS domain S-box-containing protein
MSNACCNNEQERLSLALSSAEMGTWDWDVPAGVIWWNERMHALFGLAPGTFKGAYEDFLGLIHEEDRERLRADFARVIAARTAVDTEFQVTWPSDGSDMWLGSVQECVARKIRRSCGSSA